MTRIIRKWFWWLWWSPNNSDDDFDDLITWWLREGTPQSCMTKWPWWWPNDYDDDQMTMLITKWISEWINDQQMILMNTKWFWWSANDSDDQQTILTVAKWFWWPSNDSDDQQMILMTSNDQQMILMIRKLFRWSYHLMAGGGYASILHDQMTMMMIKWFCWSPNEWMKNEWRISKWFWWSANDADDHKNDYDDHQIILMFLSPDGRGRVRLNLALKVHIELKCLWCNELLYNSIQGLAPKLLIFSIFNIQSCTQGPYQTEEPVAQCIKARY